MRWALAKAFSVAAPVAPPPTRKQTLVPTSSQTTGASGLAALAVSVMIGRRRVVDLDQLRPIASLLERLRDDHRHGVADVTHPVRRQDGVGRHERLAAIAVLQGTDERHVAKALGNDVGTGQDAKYARRLDGRLGIDTLDGRVRVRRAQDIGVSLAIGVDIIDIASGPGEEALILFPRGRLANTEFHGESAFNG